MVIKAVSWQKLQSIVRRQSTSKSVAICIVMLMSVISLAQVMKPHSSGPTEYFPFLTLKSEQQLIEEMRNLDYGSQVVNSPVVSGMPRRGKLFCFVVTSPKYHLTRAPAVWETWLPRCDRGQFYTNEIMDDPKYPYSTVFMGIEDKYENLFFKTLYALHYTYTHVSKDFDWYYKADDDTFVIVEHLREYLSTLDPSLPLYIGFRMKPTLKNGYNSGGAGYVLSKEAMRLFDEQLYRNFTLCPHDDFEDLGLGRCFESIGVFPIDTRNKLGQQRFNAYRYDDIYDVKISNDWIRDPQIFGMEAIGEDLISLHHIRPDEMRIFDQLLYTVKSPQHVHKRRIRRQRPLARYVF